MATDKNQYFRIVKGEIGPNKLTYREALTMMQTIDNRQAHKDIGGKGYTIYYP